MARVESRNISVPQTSLGFNQTEKIVLPAASIDGGCTGRIEAKERRGREPSNKPK